MKKFIMITLALIGFFSTYGQTTQPTLPQRIEPDKSKNDPITNPQTPTEAHLYYIVDTGCIIVYSMEPVCGEIIANDALTGDNVCSTYTDLGASCTFSVGDAQIISLYVVVDGITYSCEISVP